MNENGTIKHLSEALNQLLDAYETSQKENSNLKTKISELESQIEDLESQIEDLSNTTKTHSTEMDNMLNRISSILQTDIASSTIKDEISTQTTSDIAAQDQDPSIPADAVTVGEQLEEVLSTQSDEDELVDTHSTTQEQNEEDDIEDELSQEIANSIVQEVEEETSEAIADTQPQENQSKPLDLGRMQSLLNGAL